MYDSNSTSRRTTSRQSNHSSPSQWYQIDSWTVLSLCKRNYSALFDVQNLCGFRKTYTISPGPDNDEKKYDPVFIKVQYLLVSTLSE